MLREFKRVRQEKQGYRRLFVDEYFDLYIWYTRRWGKLLGFQLCYDKQADMHVLTWTRREGYAHSRVDDGDFGGGPKRTPVLIPDAFFDRTAIANHFLEASKGLSRRIAGFVHRRLLQYTEVE